MKKIIVSSSYAAEFFHVSRTTLADWQRAGAPKEGRGAWDLKALYDWHESNIATPAETRQELARAKLAKEKARAEILELDAAERRRDLLPREEIVNEFVARVVTLKTDLLAMPRRIAKWPEAKRIIDKQIRQLLTNYARPAGPLKEATGRPELKIKKG